MEDSLNTLTKVSKETKETELPALSKALIDWGMHIFAIDKLSSNEIMPLGKWAK
jgi:hypothetical protein